MLNVSIANSFLSSLSKLFEIVEPKEENPFLSIPQSTHANTTHSHTDFGNIFKSFPSYLHLQFLLQNQKKKKETIQMCLNSITKRNTR